MLLAAVPIAAALYLGIVAGIIAQGLGLGVTALILGIPLALAAGLLVGRISSQSAAAIEQGSGLVEIREAIAPLEVELDPGEPQRIEIIHPGLGPDPTAGDVAVINLARRLAERGHRPRIVLLESEHLSRDWRERLARHPEIGESVSRIELVEAGGSRPVFSPDDRVVATDWRSAHAGDRLCLELPGTRVTYLIHEYQPFQYPMGSFAALADASYELPHRAIFLDELLQRYFADQRLGVFASGPRLGLREMAVVNEPILQVRPRGAGELASSDRHRLLIASHPEEDGSGNLYELAVMALDRAVLNGHFRKWDLVSFGPGPAETALVLPRSSARMRMLGTGDDAIGAALEAQFDVGMALRFAPGLGPVPARMAAAAMSVVTTTFAGKDAAALAGISANLIPAEPRIEAIVEALATAEHRTGDIAGRIDGSRVARPPSWDEALDDRTMDAIEALAFRP